MMRLLRCFNRALCPPCHPHRMFPNSCLLWARRTPRPCRSSHVREGILPGASGPPTILELQGESAPRCLARCRMCCWKWTGSSSTTRRSHCIVRSRRRRSGTVFPRRRVARLFPRCYQRFTLAPLLQVRRRRRGLRCGHDQQPRRPTLIPWAGELATSY